MAGPRPYEAADVNRLEESPPLRLCQRVGTLALPDDAGIESCSILSVLTFLGPLSLLFGTGEELPGEAYPQCSGSFLWLFTSLQPNKRSFSQQAIVTSYSEPFRVVLILPSCATGNLRAAM